MRVKKGAFLLVFGLAIFSGSTVLGEFSKKGVSAPGRATFLRTVFLNEWRLKVGRLSWETDLEAALREGGPFPEDWEKRYGSWLSRQFPELARGQSVEAIEERGLALLAASGDQFAAPFARHLVRRFRRWVVRSGKDIAEPENWRIEIVRALREYLAYADALGDSDGHSAGVLVRGIAEAWADSKGAWGKLVRNFQRSGLPSDYETVAWILSTPALTPKPEDARVGQVGQVLKGVIGETMALAMSAARAVDETEDEAERATRFAELFFAEKILSVLHELSRRGLSVSSR